MNIWLLLIPKLEWIMKLSNNKNKFAVLSLLHVKQLKYRPWFLNLLDNELTIIFTVCVNDVFRNIPFAVCCFFGLFIKMFITIYFTKHIFLVIEILSIILDIICITYLHVWYIDLKTYFQDLLAVGLIVPLIPNHVKQMGGSQLYIGLLGSIYAGFQLGAGPLIVSK